MFVPGTVVMFGIGAMIAAGSMELLPTLLLAAVGAVLGDGISYLIGRHYHQRLRVIWPFRNYPDMIARGVDFFHKHGGKSVLLARFVGPVRPLIPAVAGMLDMPARRFFAGGYAASALWAPAYILPGLLFGASLGLAAEIAGRWRCTVCCWCWCGFPGGWYNASHACCNATPSRSRWASWTGRDGTAWCNRWPQHCWTPITRKRAA